MKQKASVSTPHNKHSLHSPDNTKTLSEEENLSSHPLLLQDYVHIHHQESLTLSLAHPRIMTPTIIKTQHHNLPRFSLFQVLPADSSADGPVKRGQPIYLRNKESALYLSAESQTPSSFANVVLVEFSCPLRKRRAAELFFPLKAPPIRKYTLTKR